MGGSLKANLISHFKKANDPNDPVNIAFNKYYKANHAWKNARPFSEKRKTLKAERDMLWKEYLDIKKMHEKK